MDVHSIRTNTTDPDKKPTQVGARQFYAFLFGQSKKFRQRLLLDQVSLTTGAMNDISKLTSEAAAKPYQKNTSLAQENAAEDQRYIAIQREWIQPPKHQIKSSPRFTEENRESGTSIMMQRWYRETMQQQPFNNLGAIGKTPYDSIGHGSQRQSNVDAFERAKLGIKKADVYALA